MDFFNAHYRQQTNKNKDNPVLNARIDHSWILYDKYYSLTDRTPIYSAAILLHPGLRKQYLHEQW
ncbi:hypothetical protein B0J12DRAFT_530070, partial [Macrophomina phaseolina]